MRREYWGVVLTNIGVGMEFVRTARAKGLRNRRVVLDHAFRNALIPLVTVVGLSLPVLVGGAAITETIFGWPGMGRLAVEPFVEIIPSSWVSQRCRDRRHRDQPGGGHPLRVPRPASQTSLMQTTARAGLDATVAVPSARVDQPRRAGIDHLHEVLPDR